MRFCSRWRWKRQKQSVSRCFFHRCGCHEIIRIESHPLFAITSNCSHMAQATFSSIMIFFFVNYYFHFTDMPYLLFVSWYECIAYDCYPFFLPCSVWIRKLMRKLEEVNPSRLGSWFASYWPNLIGMILFSPAYPYLSK